LQKLYTGAAFAAALSLATLAPPAALAAEATTQLPEYLALANDHGRIDASRQIDIVVHLRKENEAGFQRALSALYEPGSPTYHHWMTDEDLKQYDPAVDKVAAVRKELASHGLTIVSADRHNFTVRAAMRAWASTT
jgi:subtilase family serine protease